MLITYFEGVADIENNTAKELTKLGAVIQVPFQAGNQFLGEDGVQDVFYQIRDKTRQIADSHASLGKTVEGSIVQHLQKLRAEIKAHVKNVQNDTGRLAATVAKEREMSTKHISDLAKGITMLKNTPMAVVPKDDPYAQNTIVLRQLQKQVNEENALQKSIIIMQQNSAHFEEGIVRAIQSAWSTFDEWQGRMSTSVQESWKTLGVAMHNIEPDKEWIAFAARSDHLLDPETPLRNPDHIDYPGKDDPSVVPVHVGNLERKKRFTKSYKEAYYVLTPAGYLHEYATSDPYTQQSPIFSLFLPACTLGPPSAAHTSQSHKFHIEGKKSAAPHGSAGKGSLSLPGMSSDSAYTFRSRSHDEMMEWWNDLRMLVARYLVASEQMERSGPVAAAVRSAGYRSEEDDEDYSEGEGSSIEEQQEEEREEEHEHNNTHSATGTSTKHAAATTSDNTEAVHHEGSNPVTLANPASTDAPSYSAAESSKSGENKGLEMGANGFPVDKKSAASAEKKEADAGTSSNSNANNVHLGGAATSPPSSSAAIPATSTNNDEAATTSTSAANAGETKRQSTHETIASSAASSYAPTRASDIPGGVPRAPAYDENDTVPKADLDPNASSGGKGLLGRFAEAIGGRN